MSVNCKGGWPVIAHPLLSLASWWCINCAIILSRHGRIFLDAGQVSRLRGIYVFRAPLGGEGTELRACHTYHPFSSLETRSFLTLLSSLCFSTYTSTIVESSCNDVPAVRPRGEAATIRATKRSVRGIHGWKRMIVTEREGKKRRGGKINNIKR